MHFLIPWRKQTPSMEDVNPVCAVAHVMTGSLQGCRVRQQASNSYAKQTKEVHTVLHSGYGYTTIIHTYVV